MSASGTPNSDHLIWIGIAILSVVAGLWFLLSKREAGDSAFKNPQIQLMPKAMSVLCFLLAV
jgi:hypothetical protein